MKFLKMRRTSRFCKALLRVAGNKYLLNPPHEQVIFVGILWGRLSTTWEQP